MDGTGEAGSGRQEICYLLEVEGTLSGAWAEWLEAEVVSAEPGLTRLRVRVADQAELYGRLRRIHDLNLRLSSVRKDVGDGDAGEPGR